MVEMKKIKTTKKFFFKMKFSCFIPKKFFARNFSYCKDKKKLMNNSQLPELVKEISISQRSFTASD